MTEPITVDFDRDYVEPGSLAVEPRKHDRGYSPPVIDRIRMYQMYLQGRGDVSQANISRMFGYSEKTVGKVLKEEAEREALLCEYLIDEGRVDEAIRRNRALAHYHLGRAIVKGEDWAIKMVVSEDIKAIAKGNGKGKSDAPKDNDEGEEIVDALGA